MDSTGDTCVIVGGPGTTGGGRNNGLKAIFNAKQDTFNVYSTHSES